MYGVVVVLHVLGWGLFLAFARDANPAYAAAGGLAYSFGLRHAFDADHIAAVDDTTRYLMQRGDRQLGVGFFFSLGHSTIVFALAAGIAVAATVVQRHMPGMQHAGGIIGAGISSTFLMAIAIADLIILRGLLGVWRAAKSGEYRADELDELMSNRGFFNRLTGQRWRARLRHSWQMYPIGLLFGLGFDTASEVGLLALTGSAASGVGTSGSAAPALAVLALPLLFTAGMCAMDTTDGLMMTRAYGWAFVNPIRKIYYNLATVGLGVFIAATVAAVEILQLASGQIGLTGGFWDWVGNLDFEMLGYAIVGAFIVCWAGSMALYRIRRIDERYGPTPAEPS
ncbi:MAG: HoxN/HupN/NixA family nickel/cobalt transporter [Actinobacteria bacterium]|nr:HoxN/HupN/NixA family nickel/cobalt transporter [Actinomycetota bacterium]